MRMTVGALERAMAGLPADMPVVFQANIEGDEDSQLGEEPSYTTSLGYVFEAFERGKNSINDTEREFVIDGAIIWEERI